MSGIPHPPQSDSAQWKSMDPLVRDRFHEFGNYLMVIHGIIVGLSMRVPDKPEVVPILQERVRVLEEGHRGIREDIASSRTELTNMRHDLNGSNERLREDLSASSAAMREDLNNVATELRGDMASLGLKIAGGTTILVTIVTSLAQWYNGGAPS